MATTFTYVSLKNLQQYDSLLKPYIDGKVADGVKSSFKTVAIEGNTLKFYNVDAPVGATAPVYSIDLPEADVSGLVAKIKNAVAGDVVIANADGTIADGGVKLTELAKSADVTTEIGTAKEDVEKKIKSNTDAIAKLNGGVEDEGSIAKAVKDVSDALDAKITANKDVLDKLDGADTVTGSVKQQIKTAKGSIESKIGSLDGLTTAVKSDLVSAINENKANIDSAQEVNKVTVDTTSTTEGMLKSYTIKQGGKDVATIDIPKDMVVKSGVVEKNPVGQPEGTYLVLTLANAAEDKLYINVGTLVDIYIAQAEATQIQLAINPSTREISGTIVAGSIGTIELADNAIVTTKIADGNVTKVKLSKDVQASLEKADTAIQEADISDLRKDVAANKASLAEGGATANAIKANKEAAATAKSTADEAKAGVEAASARLNALESVKYVSATEDEIKALFPQA